MLRPGKQAAAGCVCVCVCRVCVCERELGALHECGCHEGKLGRGSGQNCGHFSRSGFRKRSYEIIMPAAGRPPR